MRAVAASHGPLHTRMPGTFRPSRVDSTAQAPSTQLQSSGHVVATATITRRLTIADAPITLRHLYPLIDR